MIFSPLCLTASPSPSKSMRGLSRRRPALLCALVIAAAVIVLSGVPARGRHEDDADAPPPSLPKDSTECTFALPTAASVLRVLAGDCCTTPEKREAGSCSPSSSPLPTRPVLILFTDGRDAGSDTVNTLREKVQQIATDVPSAVLGVHTYAIPAGVTERRLIKLVLAGAGRVPTLTLFHGGVAKTHVTPGAVISANPLQVPPRHYTKTPLALASYLELRSWALSELPTRYADPVTFHLIPSLQFVFRPDEVRATLGLVRNAVEANMSRSGPPALVSMAYVRLTTHGSEEVLAALSSIATQAGNAVLTLVTESAEVAAAWGLRTELTLATAPWASAVAAYWNGSASASFVAAVSDLSRPQSIGTMTELVGATSATAPWHAACAASVKAELAQLQQWRAAMTAFNTTSALRKMESPAHVLHELTVLESAMKIVFVLRESDAIWFHHHLDVAVAVAQRLRQTTVLYNITTLTKGVKERRRVERSWTPILRPEVFWLDAEQLPTVAESLHVTQVPSVLILLPAKSRLGDDGATGDDGTAADSSEDAGLRSRDPLIGVHTVDRYDLVKAAFMDDTQAGQAPVSGKDALPLFPSDSDVLLRFLSSGSFIDVVQNSLSPVRLSQLCATVAESPGAVQASKADVGVPNTYYLLLDRRYYPFRAVEEPIEGPAYVRQILNGSLQLPVRSDDGSDSVVRERHGGGRSGIASASPDETSVRTRRRLSREATAVLKKKASWQADFAKRRREKAERVRRKAVKNAAERERQQELFQQEVSAAIKSEKEGADAGGTWASQQNSLRVRRPQVDDASKGLEGERGDTRSQRLTSGAERDAEDVAQRLRRRRRYREYREWQEDRHRMVNRSVTVTEKGELLMMSQWE
ncbi:hypothetical protein LSCM1_05495 [Leishmania martiniquensis]|uniref:Uncharacterized protein n=1 Tax=Leishmania martiniquensis TaxID=1580590 RepID=A0A836KXD8_9TRYP|nr:hypothetical protein LSCM1_05495 [Leishmania martiniquensis]